MKKGMRKAAAILAVWAAFMAVPLGVFGASQSAEELRADVLHSLGLFSGTELGYQLHKPVTRMEAVTMIIHMTGGDKDAEEGDFPSPFTDVPEWGRKYAAYAYKTGISSGISEGLFGSGEACTEPEYLTFILRALGYSDSQGEFEWDNPYPLAKAAGLIDTETPAGRFCRGDMISISYRALTAQLAPQSAVAIVDSMGYNIMDLKDRLIDKGVFTADQYAQAMAEYAKGPKREKTVYLTFDDGPSKKVTPRVLDTLSEYGVPATFFVLGNMAEKYPDLVRMEYAEGHRIATHGYSHNYKYLYEKPENLLSDIKKGNEAINQALGFDLENKAFRFPGGSFGKKQVFKDQVTAMGYRYYDWNSSGEDAAKKSGSTAREIAASAVATSAGKKGDIILLFHDSAPKGTTADALPEVIKHFRDQGYVFRTLE